MPPESAFGGWPRSVVVELEQDGETAHIVISNTKEAAECLTSRWPDGEGLEFSRALAVCRLALVGICEHRQAHAAFIEAAKEAEIMVPLH